jgi:hypothetical protein
MRMANDLAARAAGGPAGGACRGGKPRGQENLVLALHRDFELPLRERRPGKGHLPGLAGDAEGYRVPGVESLRGDGRQLHRFGCGQGEREAVHGGLLVCGGLVDIVDPGGGERHRLADLAVARIGDAGEIGGRRSERGVTGRAVTRR